MPLLLLEKEHLSFEDWFLNLLRQDLLPTGYISIMGMRQEYLSLCWKEEELWQKWSDNAKEQ